MHSINYYFYYYIYPRIQPSSCIVVQNGHRTIYSQIFISLNAKESLNVCKMFIISLYKIPSSQMNNKNKILPDLFL